MKKIVLSIVTLLGLISPAILKAQSFTMADTVYATVDGTQIVYDSVMVPTGGSAVKLKWHVISSNFPSDWLTEAAFGICDNNQCYNNTGGTYIWNGISGPFFTSNTYSVSGDYHLALDLSGVSSGTHWVTVSLSDINSSTSQTATFIITKPVPSAVPAVINSDNIVLYPNPASNELNVVYDASADVKNIAVYNIIGKVITVYKVTANNSANLDIENLPSGIYFVRLMNSHGDVVVTRKFTKQ